MIGDIWKSGREPNQLDPPEPNQYGVVPFTRLIYHLDNLNDLFRAVSVDSDIVKFIQNKTLPFSESNCARQEVVLSLMGFSDVFTVHIWVIPVFQDGVLVSQLYAADDTNQQLLLKHRNPVKPSQDVYSPI